MTDKEQKASSKNKIEYEDKYIKQMNILNLSEAEHLEMNTTLFECYSMNKALIISCFENGELRHYRGVIDKIDFLNKQIILLPNQKIDIDNICKIVVKGT